MIDRKRRRPGKRGRGSRIVLGDPNVHHIRRSAEISLLINGDAKAKSDLGVSVILERASLWKHYLPPRRTMRCPSEKRRPVIQTERLANRPARMIVRYKLPEGSLWRSSGKRKEENLGAGNCDYRK